MLFVVHLRLARMVSALPDPLSLNASSQGLPAILDRTVPATRVASHNNAISGYIHGATEELWARMTINTTIAKRPSSGIIHHNFLCQSKVTSSPMVPARVVRVLLFTTTSPALRSQSSP